MLASIRTALAQDPFADLLKVKDEFEKKQGKTGVSNETKVPAISSGFSFASAPIASAFPVVAPPTSTVPSFSAPSMTSFPSNSSGFTFSSFQTPALAAQSSTASNTNNAEDDDAPIDDGGVRTNDHLIVTGEGEENDVQLHTVRAKLFKFDTKASSWVSLGTGILKVNKTVPTDGSNEIYRLICRTEGSGKVLLNSRVFKGMVARWNKGQRDVSITAQVGEDGAVGQLRIMVKDKNMAEELHGKISGAIKSVEAA